MTDKRFHEAIREWCEANNLSRAQFSRKLGITQTGYTQFEDGKYGLSLPNLKTLQAQFDTEQWHRFLTFEGAPEQDVDEWGEKRGWTFSFRQMVPALMARNKLNAAVLDGSYGISKDTWQKISRRDYIPVSEAKNIGQALGYEGLDGKFYAECAEEFAILPKRKESFGQTLYAFRYYLVNSDRSPHSDGYGGISWREVAEGAAQIEKDLKFKTLSAFSANHCGQYESGKRVPDYQQTVSIIEKLQRKLTGAITEYDSSGSAGTIFRDNETSKKL